MKSLYKYLVIVIGLSILAAPSAWAAPTCVGGWGVKKNKAGSNCPTPEQKLKGKALAKKLECLMCHGSGRNAPAVAAPEELLPGENGAVAGSWQKVAQLLMASYDPDGTKAAAGKYPSPADLIALYNEYADYMTSATPTTAQAKTLLKFIENMKP